MDSLMAAMPGGARLPAAPALGSDAAGNRVADGRGPELGEGDRAMWRQGPVPGAACPAGDQPPDEEILSL